MPLCDEITDSFTPPMADLSATYLPSLGLLLFGATAVVVNVHDTGLVPLDSVVLASGLICGGLGQLLVALREWQRKHFFGATAYTAYGLFWLSLIALLVLPGAGVGMAPQAEAMAAYLTIWGFFSAMLFGAISRSSRTLRIVFALLTVFFFLSATGVVSENGIVNLTAGYVGGLCGIVAIVLGSFQIRQGMEDGA